MFKDFSRRQFLQRSAGMTGALVASRTILLDAETIPVPTKAMAASDRVRFGIIGVGMQGSGLLTNAIQLPGVECVAAADLYSISADRLPRSLPIQNFIAPVAWANLPSITDAA